jgi:phage terminase large subunit
LASPEATILHWRAIGPAQWAQEVLGATPTEQQLDAGRKLVESRKVSIRSGHGTGKSAFMAWTILWFMCCFFPCKVPATAPTSHQLSDVLWAELAKWHRVLKERVPVLAAEFEWRSDVYELISNRRESFSVARTSRPEQPEALQGFHSDNLLFVIDEASGVPDVVFEVVEGALSTPDSWVVMAANPTRMDGYFYDSHHRMRARWAALHWNGEDSPLVSREYIDDMAQKYGVESAIYKIRVRGDFAGNPDGVIPLDLITSAIGRDVRQFGQMVWGLDIARFGEDRTALCKRHGNRMNEPIKAWRGKDLMQTAGLIKIEYDEAAIKPEVIAVDVIGMGAGVVDRCKELGLPVRGINVAESPSIQDRYNRQRDELWFRAREWFANREVAMVQDEALIAELTLPSYKVLSSGKIQVEGKDELKRRGVTSPDLADAFCLTFAPIGNKQKMQPIKYSNAGIV